MRTELTPEEVMKIGEFWGESYLSRLPVEKRLAGLNPKDVLKHLGTQNVLKHLGTQDVLRHMGLREILSQADPAEVESCLNQLKRKKKKAK